MNSMPRENHMGLFLKRSWPMCAAPVPPTMCFAGQEVISYIGQGLCNSEIQRRTRHCRQLIAGIREKVRTKQNLFER
jgi:hypothetical protein